MCFIEKNNKLESVLTFLHLFDLFAANLSGSWAIYFWLESGDPVYSWEQTGISQDALAPCMWYCSFDWRLISDFGDREQPSSTMTRKGLCAFICSSLRGLQIV